MQTQICVWPNYLITTSQYPSDFLTLVSSQGNSIIEIDFLSTVQSRLMAFFIVLWEELGETQSEFGGIEVPPFCQTTSSASGQLPSSFLLSVFSLSPGILLIFRNLEKDGEGGELSVSEQEEHSWGLGNKQKECREMPSRFGSRAHQVVPCEFIKSHCLLCGSLAATLSGSDRTGAGSSFPLCGWTLRL